MLTVKNACCRYCSECIDGDGIICGAKNLSMSEKYAKSYHKCIDFDFNEIDVFDFDRKYKPRVKSVTDINQASFFGGDIKCSNP